MTQTQAGLNAAINSAMEVARDVIDRRINALGTLEPTIIRQGSSRIVVQVPGLEDPEALKALIGRTARLEFKLVDLTATPDQLQSGRGPVGSQILAYPEGGTGGRIAVQRRAIITGDQIADAQQGFDPTDGRPVVTIRFDSTGSRRFARVTTENVNRPFAIVLDNVVMSAPNINEPILGGSAQISGNFTVESANALAISLRSGRLPVELTVVEERTVGPDLGADSIRRGAMAAAVGSVLVLIFMFITYGRFGIYADIAIMLNVALVMGIMSIMNATLTLPGIAGFVLTVGAAVDANVIINKRLRDDIYSPQHPHPSNMLKDASRPFSTPFTTSLPHLSSLGSARARICRGDDDRDRDVGLYRRHGHPHVRLLLAAQAAEATGNLGTTMRLLKLVPDNTNIDFLRWRNWAVVFSALRSRRRSR